MLLHDLDMTRLRLLELHKLLLKVSVSKKMIKLSEIKEQLNDLSELGGFDRRTFYRDLYLLNEITNLEIEYSPKIRAYRVQRYEKLSKSELTVIINAILSARFDSEDETISLMKKIDDFAGSPKIRTTNRVKLGDGDSYKKIDFVQNAIDKQTKILFDYQKYNIDKNYEITRKDCLISPYKLVWHNDKMYLIGSYGGDVFSHYRIERICNLRETDEPVKNISDIIGYGRTFDEAEYLRKMTEVSSGKVNRVVIRFHDECLGEVIDAFGNKVRVRSNKNGTFTLDDDIFINKKLKRWIISFGSLAEVITPVNLREEVKDAMESVLSSYID